MRLFWLMFAVLGLFYLAQLAQADWEPVKRVTWTSGYSNYPSIAADPSGNLHVVWGDATPGNAEIYYTASTDSGASWTPAKRLTWNSCWSQSPAISAAPSGGLYVAWHDSTPSANKPEIYFMKSTDGGAAWTTPKRLTWTSYSSTAPDLAVGSASHIHLAWDDLILPANFEIYYKKSKDEGVTWSASRRFTWTSSGSFAPEIAVDSVGNVHVVWMEGAHGPFEIYDKKSTDG